jgi:hypothetical protein
MTAKDATLSCHSIFGQRRETDFGIGKKIVIDKVGYAEFAYAGVCERYTNGFCFCFIAWAYR